MMLLSFANHTAFLIYLFMGFHSYHSNPRGKVNHLFLAVCLLFAYITCFELIIPYKTDPVLIYTLIKLQQLGWLIYPALLLTTVFLISHKEHCVGSFHRSAAIYLPAVTLCLYELFINNYSLKQQPGVLIMAQIELFYRYTYLFFCLVLIWLWKRNAKSAQEIRQAGILLKYSAAAFMIGLLNNPILVLLIPGYPLLGHITFLLIVFSIWLAMFKYKFLSAAALITAEDVVSKISEIVLILNPEGIITDSNAAGARVLGYQQEELIGKSSDIITGLSFAKVLKEMGGQDSYTWESGVYLKTRQKKGLPVKAHLSAVKDSGGYLTGFLFICQDQSTLNKLQTEINERKAKERELKYLSLHDPLTGLYNRTHFEQQMADITGPCSIIVCDVDGLKLINDTFGHDTGDQLLSQVGKIIQSELNGISQLARIGGDEFAVLIPHNNKEKIYEICAGISQAIQDYNKQIPQPLVSISIGFAVSESTSGDIEQLYREADDNMYREKLNHMQSYRSRMVQGMMKTLEARDFLTEGHAERMRELICRLGVHAGLRSNMLTSLQLLAQFHDIGKVGISDKILFKPDRLTDDERLEIQRHSEIGYRIAQSVPELSNIADLILQHHECWDGSGYPLGLKGTEITLECRILAIIDAFDAMTNDRPYRLAMTEQEALAEIEDKSGTQFDPELVALFLDMLGSKKEAPSTLKQTV